MPNDQIDSRELVVILRELEATVSSNGDVVELGCYKGSTSVEIQKVMSRAAPQKRLYLYDSFEGLPPKSRQDASPAGEQFRAGELPASKKEVIRRFNQAHMPLPIIKRGWFGDLTDADMPSQISFAFLDGDFYDSIKDSLRLIWPHLNKGSVVVVDDYQNEALPGAQKAVDEWLSSHPAKLRVESSLALIHPV